MSERKVFGLIGYPLSHSFSKKYFTDKFSGDKRYKNYRYENFEISNISELLGLIQAHADLIGLNVTIPYKETVIPYLSELNTIADECGAVNTILIEREPIGAIHTTGFNTDVSGFIASIKPLLKGHHTGAVVLGSGGASKAVCYAFKQLKMPYVVISRNKNGDVLSYNDLTQDLFLNYPVIINTTPLGTFPDTQSFPPIPFQLLNESNLLFDMVYNPAETQFLLKGKEQGADTVNGFDMLTRQAEEAFKIWESI